MRTSAPGLTLIETMMVLIIIGILMSFMMPRMGRVFQRAKATKTEAIISRMIASLQEYSVDVGHFPSSREGLEALIDRPGGRDGERWKGSYLEGAEEVPLDAWGNDFEYNAPPQEHSKKYKYFEIISRGATEDDSSDDIIKGS